MKMAESWFPHMWWALCTLPSRYLRWSLDRLDALESSLQGCVPHQLPLPLAPLLSRLSLWWRIQVGSSISHTLSWVCFNLHQHSLEVIITYQQWGRISKAIISDRQPKIWDRHWKFIITWNPEQISHHFILWLVLLDTFQSTNLSPYSNLCFALVWKCSVFLRKFPSFVLIDSQLSFTQEKRRQWDKL